MPTIDGFDIPPFLRRNSPEEIAASKAAVRRQTEERNNRRITMGSGKVGAKEQKLREMRAVSDKAKARGKAENLDQALAAAQGRGLDAALLATELPPAAMKDAAQPKESSVMKTSTSRKTKPAAKPAKPVNGTSRRQPAKKADGRSSARESTVRPGSKLELIRGLLLRKQGCTTADILSLVGWPAVSVPAQAKAAGLKLTKEKAKGEPTVYRGTPA